MLSLTIISHTPHYYGNDGAIVGLEPTVREINYLSQLFETIYHVAPLHSADPHNATSSYISKNIIYIPIKPTGGEKIFSKLNIFYYMPYNLYKIIITIVKTQWIQFRAPTNLGLFVLPLLSVLKNKNKWVKYAGDWEKKSIPISYKLQRWWLRMNLQKSIVTINGNHNKQQSHLLSFVNPCLTEKEITNNRELGYNKTFIEKFTLCFVGRLDEYKGFPALLDAIGCLGKVEWIDKLHCVGENSIDIQKKYLIPNNIPIIFHGILNRQEINQIYEDSHFIILPSKSEGFPKVLSEASSFGCIPIAPPTTAIISIINEKRKNGIILSEITSKGIKETIEKLHKMRFELSTFSENAMDNARQFSYEKYNKRIINEIIQD